MKVLLINGSPTKYGCTYTALQEVANALQANGVQTEIFQIGKNPVRGCIACEKCRELHRCVFSDDIANEICDAMAKADGIVIGSPVYYAGPNGALCALLDRIFYASSARFKHKPAAAVVSCRRAGSTAALDRLNKYITISMMPMATSQYWNMVHGNEPEEVRQDEEGMQIMRTLGQNMAWMLHTIQESGMQPPKKEPSVWTNFIR